MNHLKHGALILLFGAAIGCTRQPAHYPVQGRVTFDGKPAANVDVQFHRTGPGLPHTAIPAKSDADGRYTVVSPGTKGILAGEYVVVFSKFAMPDGSPVAADAKPGEVGAVQLLPERYQSVEARVHVVTVEKDLEVDFDLKR